MKIFDFNCFAGDWPFYRLRINTFEKMLKTHEKSGISGGIVSSLNAVFYNDPYEADSELYNQIKDTNYGMYLCVNPLLINAKGDILKSISQIKPKGIRIYPGIHGYSLNEKKLSGICDLLKQLNLPLVITQRMEDERVSYLIQAKNPSADELNEFLKGRKDLKTLITGVNTREILAIKDKLVNRDNLFIDISNIKSSPFPIENIIKNGVGKNLIFGSNMPLNSLESILFMAQREKIEDEIRKNMLLGEKFIKL